MKEVAEMAVTLLIAHRRADDALRRAHDALGEDGNLRESMVRYALGQVRLAQAYIDELKEPFDSLEKWLEVDCLLLGPQSSKDAGDH